MIACTSSHHIYIYIYITYFTLIRLLCYVAVPSMAGINNGVERRWCQRTDGREGSTKHIVTNDDASSVSLHLRKSSEWIRFSIR